MSCPIHEEDTGIKNEPWTQRGRAPRQRGLRVEDCNGASSHERSGTILVEVGDVDDGDIARLKARRQVLGPVVNANPPAPGTSCC